MAPKTKSHVLASDEQVRYRRYLAGHGKAESPMPALTSDERLPYDLPQPCFGPCPTCGEVVLERRWLGDAKRWMEEDPPRTPCLGLEHSVAQGTCRPTQGAQP
jgi:hypothetical protein